MRVLYHPEFPKDIRKIEAEYGRVSAGLAARFVAFVHNLLLLLQDLHKQHGVENTAERQCKQTRLAQQEKALGKTRQTLPLVYKTLQRFTQAPFKLIRWLRAHWHQPTTLSQALLHLARLYAQL